VAQIRQIVVKYLNDNPQRLHRPAALLVIFALTDAFPLQAI